MSKPKVLVCVLCGPERYQWPAPGLMMRLIEAARLQDFDVRISPVYGVYGYDAARNTAVEMFLSTDADVLCMCDNDTVPPADFIRLALARPDADVVALPYYTRANFTGHVTTLCTGWNGPEPNTYDLPFQLPSGWREIHVAGAGCLFIKRRVLSKVRFCIPDFSRKENMVHGAGEDFEYCRQVRAAGFHVWTNGDLLCDHLHTMSLTAVARATVAREDADIKALRSVGINVPDVVRVSLPPHPKGVTRL